MNNYFRSLIAFVIFLILLQSVVISVAGLKRPHWGDEEHFVQTVRLFGEEISLNTLKHYNEMSTPLPFLTYALWGRIFGFETNVLRILSVIIALLTYLLFHRFLFLLFQEPKIAFFTAVFLAVHPYMVGFSIFVFTDMLPILFLIVACIAVIKGKAVVFALAAAGTLLCRQHFIFLPVAAGLFYLLSFLTNRNETRTKRSATRRMLPASILSLAPLGLLFLIWQGFSPDNEMRKSYLDEGFYFHPSYLTLYVCLLFVYLIPIVVVRWRRIYSDRRILVGSFIISWLYWLFPVGPSKYAIAIDVHTVGLFHRLLQWIWPGGFFEQVVFYAAFLLGLPILILLIKDCYQKVKRRDFDLPLFLDMSILAFLVILPFSYMCWEKYFLPVVPLAAVRLLLIGYERELTVSGQK
jgi:hypothetical protein